MEIWITFYNGKFSISPDPARVKQGALITWRFQTLALTIPSARWLIYFDHGAPFRAQGTQFSATTAFVNGQHTGATGAVSADEPGDYKYGVRLIDPANQQTLGDDDPQLIIVP